MSLGNICETTASCPSQLRIILPSPLGVSLACDATAIARGRFERSS